ncbi:E3 SUMO-protein ligase NSE2 [Balamuthia mandrillaris]
MANRDLDMLETTHRALLAEMKVSIGYAIDVGVSFAEAGNGDEEIKQLEECTIKYVHMEREVQNHIQAITDARNGIASNNRIEDVEEFLENRKRELASEEVDHRSHPKYREFIQKVWAVKHPNEALPDLGEDFMVVTQDLNILCPITRKELEEPFKNQVCGHCYSKEAILEYLRTRRGKRECPVAGCSASVTKKSLEHDVDMERKIRQIKRRQKRTQRAEEEDVTQL